jgi:hypothetical protein
VSGTYDDARSHFAALEQVGIDHQGLIDALEREGLSTFEDSRPEPCRTGSDEPRKAAGAHEA